MRAALACLLLAAASPARASAQFDAGPLPPGRIGSVPMVLAEHGDATPALALAASLAGSIVHDIASAPSSARSHNERHPDAPRLPERALMLSLASTVVPVLAGTGALSRNAYVPGGVAVYKGLVLGPSVGHWYAGRWGRGLASAGLRFGLLTAAGFVVLMAS